ncbi:MAG: hypothetical protein ACNA78_06695 [Balneolaceae bacterium]
MMRITTFSTLFIAVMLFAVSCSDSVSSDDIPDIPEFPSLSAASTLDEQQQIQERRSESPNPGTHFDDAFQRVNNVFFAFGRAASTPRLIFQQLSENVDPSFSDNQFTWKLEDQITGDLAASQTATARFLGNNEIEWTLKTGFDAGIPLPGLGEIILFRGTDRNNPQSSTFQVMDPTSGFGFTPEIDPDNRFGTLSSLFDLSWELNDDGSRVVTLQGNGSKSGFLFQIEQQQNEFSLLVERPDEETVQFVIDLESGAGYLVIDGEQRCWDSSLQNSECPA